MHSYGEFPVTCHYHCVLGIFVTSKDIENVSAEILKMSRFDHPNVMQLIGVCVAPSAHGDNGTGPCIVMPFMAKGSLLDFLRKEADNLCVESEGDIDHVRTLFSEPITS